MKPLMQLLSLVVAGLSFFTVCLVALFLAITPSSLALAVGGQPSLGLPQTPGLWVWVALAGVAGFYASFPVARCLGRFFPVRLNGTRRYGLILVCVFFGALWLVIEAPPGRLRETFLTMVPMTMLVLGTVAWTLIWQTRSTRSLDTRFILYLRRFSSFSDRSVLTAFLAARPYGYRAAFLAPLAEAAANFSPMVMAFSGTRLWRPLASCPFPVAARNVEWEDNVEALALAAECVVIDVSDRSPAIAREIEIVEHGGVAPERVLWLVDETRPHMGVPASGARHIVRYRRSWRAAIPRVVLEMLTVGIVLVILWGTLSTDPQFAAVPSWAFVLGGFALSALAAPVILQPSVTRSNRREMKRALQAILSVPRDTALPSSMAIRRQVPRRCIVLSREDAGHVAFLSHVATRNGLTPTPMVRPAQARSFRDAIRQLKDAALVIADLSRHDPDVEYLLGVAHGLGRKVILVAGGVDAPMRDAVVHRFGSDSADSAEELAAAIKAVLQNPLHQGPVASLLADEWVFGDKLAGPRVLAFLLDAGVSAGLAFGYLDWRHLVPEDSVARAFAISQTGFVILVFYRFLGLALAGTTPGMALTGLRVVDADGGDLRPGQALGRSVATCLAVFPFASALTALFGPRHQVLEDMLSTTRVVRR